MSIKIMQWVWDNSPLEGSQLLVHLALADSADEKSGECWPSQKFLAERGRCHVETVRKTVRRLEDLGMLSVLEVSNGRKNNLYRLTPKKLGPTRTVGATPQISSEPPPNSHGGDPPIPAVENHHVTVNNRHVTSDEYRTCSWCGRTDVKANKNCTCSHARMN